MNTCLYANELDDYACAVYCKHWDDGTLHKEDIRNVTKDDVCRRGVPDVICGGFPCTDVSVAGKRAGIEGSQSGLWKEMHRLVCEIRPRYVVVENVPGLLSRGMGVVLGDLAEVGYDAEWEVLPAAAFGAPHIRERVFIVAYTTEFRNSRYEIYNRQYFEGYSKKRREWICPQSASPCNGATWEDTTYTILGVLNGIPSQLDFGERVKCLGNSIVPQVAEYVGHCIMEHIGGEFTFAELFAGIGGFRLGFEMASSRNNS